MAHDALDFGKLTNDPANSYTLPGRFYTDPAVWEQEKERIFYRSWNFVTSAASLAEPGAYLAVQIADQNIFVVRGHDGELRAFYNVCSHRAHELVKGQGRASVISCPYHAWTYDLTGDLRRNPAIKRMEEFDTKEFCLKPVRLEEFCGFVFVNLDPNAASMKAQYGNLEAEIRKYNPVPEKMVLAKRITYELKANWKNVVDNFLECYHCPPAHPAFVELIEHAKYRVIADDKYVTQISPAQTGANGAYKLDPASADQSSDYAGFWFWPNVAFNIFPGQPNVTIFHFIPTGPETTLENFDFYLATPTPDAAAEGFIEYIDKTLQVEDIGLVESVQRGLHSKAYHQGRLIFNDKVTSLSEHGVHRFHSLVRDALTA
jgi:choline monooxygenase